MHRFERMEAIKRIINENNIRSQEQLLSELRKSGYDVTQATLSRDLKQLRVSKISDGVRGYLYNIPGIAGNQLRSNIASEYKQDLKRGFISLVFSGNICMIKTLSGHANSVASAIDNIQPPGIIGTVAGDDTIFALLAEGSKVSDIEGFFKGIQ